MRSIELFSGAGGLALGLHLAGFQHNLLVESNKDAIDTLQLNVKGGTVDGIEGWTLEHCQVEEILGSGALDVGDIDILAAGIPCQPFSKAGNHRGHADERNMLPLFAQVLSRMRPKSFLLENVDGLVRASENNEHLKLQLAYPEVALRRHESQETYTQDLLAYASTTHPAYAVHIAVLNAADYGVPQIRKRVFLIGFRSDINVQWKFPEPSFSKTALLQDQWVTGEYWERHNIRVTRRLAPKNTVMDIIRDGTAVKPWQTIRDAILGMPTPIRHGVEPLNWQWHVAIPGARIYPGHTGSEIDLPAKTIKAGAHGVPGGENILVHSNRSFRYLTLRECAVIQTFPTQWRFAGPRSSVTRQIGNAVPVELARIIGLSIRASLELQQEGSIQDQATPERIHAGNTA